MTVETGWVKDVPAEIMVCDQDGIILDMNDEAERLFAEDGGGNLTGTNVLLCHPEEARLKLEDMLARQAPNAYYNTENGEKRFFYQAPWYKNGRFAGFVEISFEVPGEIEHFRRG